MSLFGSLMGDFDDDIFGNHMNAMNMQMRSMNRLMNSFMPDPFNMLTNFDGGFQQNALMERQNPHPMGGLFGFPTMPNMNRLITADIGNNSGAAFCSSSVISMSAGPDGRPQIYQATSSTKTGPGGIRETRRTVQDSINGVKKMAIGHHIGDRAHIIEKEQDLRSGQLEEHQEFINLEEDEAEDFDREFVTKAHCGGARGGVRAIAPAPVPQQALTIEEIDDDDDVIETVSHASSSSNSQLRRHLPAVPAPPQPSSSSQANQSSSPSELTSSTSVSTTKMSPPSSSIFKNNINAGSSALLTTSVRSSSVATAPRSHSSSMTSSGIDNEYPSTTSRRSSYRSNHHMSGVSGRRPLRTPPSSPLATTPTLHSHSTTSTPSVHPHPYNTPAARRSHHHHHHQHQHRPKQHGTKHHAATSVNTNNQTPATISSQPREENINSK